MKLYRRKNSPFWWFDIGVPGGRIRQSSRCTSRIKAKEVMIAAALEIEKTAAELKALASRPAGPTLADVLDAHVRRLRLDGRPSAQGMASLADKTTARGNFADSGRFALPERLLIRDLTWAHLADLREARMAEGNSMSTIGHELRLLRAAMNYARDAGHTVPTIKWRIPEPLMKTRYLSLEEWRAVYDQLDPHALVRRRQSRRPGAMPTPDVPPSPRLFAMRQQAQDLFVTLTLCGGRWGEVARLTTDQITPEGHIRIFGTKTQRERLVPCPDALAGVLQRRRELAVAAGSPFLFLSPDKQTAQKRSGAIGRAIDRAGLNAPHLVERHGRAVIHSFRHTFASWLAQSGTVGIEEVQELLGHTTLQMTRRYSHLTKGHVAKKAAGILDSVMTGIATERQSSVAPSTDQPTKR